MKIAYLGPEGTFTSTAAKKMLNIEKYKSAFLVPCTEMEAGLYVTQEGRYDYGCVLLRILLKEVLIQVLIFL